MLGPPSEALSGGPGIAESCTWRDSFGPPTTSHRYRLSLAFGDDGEVVAGGLFVNGDARMR